VSEDQQKPVPDAATSNPVRPPSLIAGMSLLGIAAVLMVVVLVNPSMPSWLRTVIAILAVLVVVVLIGYAAYLFRVVKRGNQR